MYTGLLHTHSYVRYLILVVLIITLLRTVYGYFARKEFSNLDNKLGIALLALVHLQFLMGITLYFISPVVKHALSEMPSAMSNPELRFWAVEHPTIMILFVILVTVGRITSKKGKTDAAKFKRALIFYGIGFLLFMGGVPWLAR